MLSDLPEGWVEKKLIEIAGIKIGRTPSRSKAEFWANNDCGLSWLKIKDLKNKIIKETEEKITTLGALQSKSKLVKNRTLLMSFKLTIGKMAFAGCDLYTNEAIVAIDENKDVANKHFLFYFLPAFITRIEAEQAVKGKTLNKEKLAIIPITLPPLKEQERIAEILNSVDDSISATERVIAQAELVKRGLMEELLTGGLGSRAIERGEVPEGWEMRYLTEISSVATGKRNANHADKNGKHRFYTCALEHSYCSTARFNGKSIIVPGNGANVGRVFFYDGQFDAYQRTYVIHNVLGNSKFLFFHMQHYWYLSNEHKQFGSATNFIKIDNFNNYSIAYPPASKQKRIAKILNSIDETISTNESVMAQLKRIKTGLMQDLLSGKVRVLQ